MPPKAKADALFSNEGNWQIVVSDEYHGCIARAQYRDGTRVTYGVDGITNSPFINFSNYQWSEFISGSIVKVEFPVTYSGTFSGYAHVITRGGMPTLELGDIGNNFISAFEAAPGMKMFADGNYLTEFDLTGTSAAFSAVFRCHATQ
jgi:hypothetical protein